MLRADPSAVITGHQAQPVNCANLCTVRDACLHNAGFRDIFKSVKDSENVLCLALLPGVLAELDGVQEAAARLELALKGVFAGEPQPTSRLILIAWLHKKNAFHGGNSEPDALYIVPGGTGAMHLRQAGAISHSQPVTDNPHSTPLQATCSTLALPPLPRRTQPAACRLPPAGPSCCRGPGQWTTWTS